MGKLLPACAALFVNFFLRKIMQACSSIIIVFSAFNTEHKREIFIEEVPKVAGLFN